MGMADVLLPWNIEGAYKELMPKAEATARTPTL
jgi:hypothetical protein